MKFMRQIWVTAFLTIGIFSAILYSACSKDNCNNVACQNGGSCDGGNCICASGFEGNRCQTPSRDKWIGNYNGGDSCGTDGNHQYPIHLLAVLNKPTQMVMENILNNTNDSAICNVYATDSFSFNGSNNSVTYRGSGRISNDSLFMSYHVQYDTMNYDCKYSGLRY